MWYYGAVGAMAAYAGRRQPGSLEARHLFTMPKLEQGRRCGFPEPVPVTFSFVHITRGAGT